MVHFDPEAPINLETDTSKYIYSGILSQHCEDGKWRPLAYQSKTMQDAECNYDVHDKELLAIIQADTEWKRYLRWESETSPGSHRQQKSGYLYNDQETKRKTSEMEDTPQSLELPNPVLTRKRRRKTGRSYKKSRRPINSRRQTTYEEVGGITPQRMLGHTERRRNQDRRNGASRIAGPEQRNDTTSIQYRRRDTGYQGKPGKRS